MGITSAGVAWLGITYDELCKYKECYRHIQWAENTVI